jgi:Caspase domain
MIRPLLGGAFACAMLAVASLPSSAASERVALIIGNGAYRHTNPLPNPPNDAADVAAALRAIGFDVVEGRDLDKRAMEAKIIEFGRKLERANLAAFFYAGHGLQVGGKNYLVPIDAKVERAAELGFETIEVNQVLAQMEGDKRVNLVFLDACRDNPLARSLARSLATGSRSTNVGQGLAILQGAAGTMIAYATQPDNVALDGVGRNSPFTAALLRHIATPGLEVSSLMKRVRADVVQTTNQKQVPWDHSSLMGDVVLVPGVAPQNAPAKTPPAPALGPAQVALPSDPGPRSVPPRSATESCATFKTALGVDRYCASSILSPQLGNSYGVQHLFSGNGSSAWVEGRPGQGIGEWVVVEFDGHRLVRGFEVLNGYQKNSDIYAKNSRVRRLRAVFSQGESLTFNLQDKFGPQTISLDRPIKAYWVQFVIDEVYPGNRYTDTALSRLLVATDRVP